MKTAKKVLLSVMAGALLVAGSVAGTLAWLSSTTETVTNTFTVGDVEITLDETDVDNSTASKDRDIANKYHLIPGSSYTKDPIVHVDEDSEQCYLFVKVVNAISDIEDNANEEASSKIADQMKANNWEQIATGSNIWRYKGVVDVTKGQVDYPVFEAFKIKKDVTDERLEELYKNKPQITVQAFAIQTENVSVDEAVIEANKVFNPVQNN